MMDGANKKANHVFIVTGAGRGLGRNIAKVAAERAEKTGEMRHMVLVGRDQRSLLSISGELVSTNVRTYTVPNVDLSQPGSATASQIINKVVDVVRPLADANLQITLVQCAGTLGDLSKCIYEYNEDEIAEYIHINQIAFTVLTSQFLKYAKSITAAEHITMVNISSLLAIQAFSNWGLYGSVKAARDQLFKIAALEHKNDTRFRFLSYAPGPLDNDMQADVRNTINDKEQKEIYTSMHAADKLVSTEFTAGILCDLLENNKFKSGDHIDIYDIVEPAN